MKTIDMEHIRQNYAELFSDLRDTYHGYEEFKRMSLMSPERLERDHGDTIRTQFQLMRGGVPVLICARNERDAIGVVLYGLSKSTVPVQPIVVDNCSSDGTGELAQHLGATVLYEHVPGLMHALRKGFVFFAKHSNPDMILLTDADAYPTKNWARTMSAHAHTVNTGQGAEVFGPIIRVTADRQEYVKNFIITGGGLMLDMSGKMKNNHRAHGQNACIIFDNRDELTNALANTSANRIMKTDDAIRNVVLSNGGSVDNCLKPGAVVFNASDRYPNLNSVMKRVLFPASLRTLYKDWFPPSTLP